MKINQKDFFCERLTEVFTFHLQQLNKGPLNMAEQKNLDLVVRNQDLNLMRWESFVWL
tara:strand:- start:215 stop:388 length:174 start_codon:yes stop_codon:yes gene_type:complete